MPITAPRFTPTGNLPSAMPTPQASGADGLASGLASIGDSLASLGKSAEYAKAVQERRDAMAKASVEAAANDAFVQWDLDTKEGYGKFKTEAVGAQTMNRRGAFGEHLQRDTSSYTKDLSPEAAAEFDKRVQIARRTNSIAADEIAANRHGDWVIKTQSVALEQAMDSAAVARVAQDDAGYNAAFSQVVKAINSRAAYTGEEWDASMLMDSVEYSALRKIVVSKEYASASEFHAKSKFGAFQGQADELMKPVNDIVWAQQKDAEYAKKYTKPNGVYETEAALSDALQNAKGNERQMDNLSQAITQRGAQNMAMRNKQADDVIGALRLFQLNDHTNAGSHSPDIFLKDPTIARIVDAMTPEKRAIFDDRLHRGPVASNPEHKARMDSLLYSASPQELAAVGRWDYSVSESDWEKFDKARSLTADPLDGKVGSIVKDLYTENGLRAPPPRATREKPNLSDAEQAQVAEYTAIHQYAMKALQQPGVAELIKKDPNQIYRVVSEAYRDANEPVTLTIGGEEVQTTKAKSGSLELGFVVTDDLMKQAGVKNITEPGAKLELIKAYKAQQAAEAVRQAEIEMQRRMRADGRPMTDAEMRANRDRIGEAWRRAIPGGRAASAQHAWMTPGIPGLGIQEYATPQPDFGTASGPNVNYRDY